jgi:hypothetical protein
VSDHEVGSTGFLGAVADFWPVCEQPAAAKPSDATINPALRNGRFMAHHLL